MSVDSYTLTQSFNRPVAHPTIPTPVDMTLFAQVGPTQLKFTDGVLIIFIKGDADERPGIQNIGTLFRCQLTPSIDASGNMSLNSYVMPVSGLGVDAITPYPTSIDCPHSENADTWMAEKGRNRQDYSLVPPNEIDDQLLFTGSILTSPFFDWN